MENVQHADGGRSCRSPVVITPLMWAVAAFLVYGWSYSPSVVDLSSPEDDFHARLTIKPSGLHIVTEIVTTLILNRMAQDLNWQ